LHDFLLLLQEVRKVVEAGLPDGLASQLGSIILDSRYSTASTRARLRSALAAAVTDRQHPQSQQQQQQPAPEPLNHEKQQQQQQHLAQSVPDQLHNNHSQQQQQQQQQHPAHGAATGPQNRGFSTWPTAARVVSAKHTTHVPWQQQRWPVQHLAAWPQQLLPSARKSASRQCISIVASSNRQPLPACLLQRRNCSTGGPVLPASRVGHVSANTVGWRNAVQGLQLLRRYLR
jgi:hypothetical protein